MMVKTVNRVTLIGYVVREPEVRDFPSGGQVMNLMVKTMEQWNDRQTGELREISQQNRVSVYVASMISSLRGSLHEGDLVYVEGRLETRRTQDNMGNDRYFTEVSVRPYHGSIAPLGKSNIAADSKDMHSGNNQGSQDRGGYSRPQDGGFDSNQSSNQSSDTEDPIPF